MKPQVSLACWPGLRHERAAGMLLGPEPITEPLFGELGTQHVQLVPQSFGVLTEELAATLASRHARTAFRLHANVRVLPGRCVADVSGLVLYPAWYVQAARVSQILRAPAYSAHAGHRAEATFETMLDNTRRLEDLFQCPVAVEGQYPMAGDPRLVSHWEEYQALFESGVKFALDLSHLNILAHQSGRREEGLVAEMLACERCIEVHVSANDGRGDHHQICATAPWWIDLLPHINADAVVFSEGNHRRRRNHVE